MAREAATIAATAGRNEWNTPDLLTCRLRVAWAKGYFYPCLAANLLNHQNHIASTTIESAERTRRLASGA